MDVKAKRHGGQDVPLADYTVVRAVGLEPTLLLRNGILNPARLPFRHARVPTSALEGR
jgi:hypothetical protein